VARLARIVVPLSVLLHTAAADALVWPNEVARIEAGLVSESVTERRRAANRLSALPDAASRRLALEALDDPDVEVKLAAAELVLDLRLRELPERTASLLTHSDRRVRLAACRLMEIASKPELVAALGRTLADADPSVRAAAARALGASGQPEAVQPLLGRLDDTDPRVRREVVAALASSRDERAVLPLTARIQDVDPEVRRAAIVALGAIGDKRAGSALLLALRDSDESVRIAALEALGTLRDTSSASAIIHLVREVPAPRVQRSGYSALARLGTPESLDALVALLGSDHPNIDSEALHEALGRAGEAALLRLERCLGGQPPKLLARGCALSLARTDTTRAALLVSDALRQGQIGADTALGALGRLARQESLPVVLEHLSHKDRELRLLALTALEAVLDPVRPEGRAVDPLALALEQHREDRHTILTVVRLLGRTGSPRAAAALLPLAEQRADTALRLVAVESLGMLGSPANDRALLAALDDDAPSVRLAAAMALRRTGGAASARPLLERYTRSPERDRAAILLALSGPLRTTKDEGLVEQLVSLAVRGAGGECDAIIEALGHAPSALSVPALQRVAESPNEAARAKAAESLAGHTAGRTLLERLARDRSASVRASAIWALASVARREDLSILAASIDDVEIAVAANAAFAVARVGKTRSVDVQEPMCRALGDGRSAVRANALAGLRLLGATCPDVASLLRGDRSARVRRAAAVLLSAQTSDQSARRELERCTEREPNAEVALACGRPADRTPDDTEPVIVFVIPAGSSVPVPRAPFGLELADGSVRYGCSDRRGAVHERYAPRGTVRLTLPAHSYE
jgi:HEAT repeat protein